MFSWYHFYLFLEGLLRLLQIRSQWGCIASERQHGEERILSGLTSIPKKDRVEALLTAARAPESHVAVADARVRLDIH